MAILETEVWVTHSPKTVKHYEGKGYEFPRVVDKRRKLVVPRGTKILVKVEDLIDGSNVKLTKICDAENCGNEVPNQQYREIIESRKTNKDGLDRCAKCASSEQGIKSGIANIENCVATTHPEFAKLFWNVQDTFRYTYGSSKEADFKCVECDEKIPNKKIYSMYAKRLKLPCPACSDGLSYPEKFMYSVLEQIRVNFEKELNSSIFTWCENYRYDFWLNELNVIIETHGEQHYEKTRRGKSLQDEQKNDKIKYDLAIKNGIKKENYIVIDCRKSEMEWIRNEILSSELNKLFDLSKVNWLRAHEFSCSSLVKKACDLWNSGIKSTVEIGKILNLGETTVREYLKKGVQIDWCDYDPKEARRISQVKAGKNNAKILVQLTLNGEFIREWESGHEVDSILNINKSSVSSVCNGQRNSAGGYKWMFKEDYDQCIDTQK